MIDEQPVSSPVWPHGLTEAVSRQGDEGVTSTELAAEARNVEPCMHRGAQSGLAACLSCGGKRNLPQFECHKHGRCTTTRRAVDSSIKFCGDCPDAAAPWTLAPTPGAPEPWLGTARKKSWEYPVQLVMAHWETPDILELAIELWRQQTVRPYICIVDTGSSRPTMRKLMNLESEDVEIHFLRAHDYLHPSGAVFAALDVAASRCHQVHQLHTHTDVFPRRRDLIEWLTPQCTQRTPVVGYEMSPRDFVKGKLSTEWRGMVGHTLTMLHSRTMRRIKAQWHIEIASDEYGFSIRNHGDIDTEVPFNLQLRSHGIKPKFIGHDTNYEFFRDENIDHFRSYAGSKLYATEYHKDAQAWADEAMSDARDRLQEWGAAK